MNIEESMTQNRVDRQLQHGAGADLQQQVVNRQKSVDNEESLKYYRRKGISTIGNFKRDEMYESGFDPVENEDGTSTIPNKFMKTGERTIFGYDVNGHKVDNMPGEASPLGSIPRVAAGAYYDVIKGAAEFGEDIIPKGLGPLDTGRAFRQKVLATPEPAWLDDTAGWGEDVARDIAQFGAGYAGVFKGIGAMGIKSLLAKDVAGAVIAGQTFDPEEGNLSTFLNEYDMLPDAMRFLDAKMTTEEQGKFSGRMALAIEEAGLGVGFSAIRIANRAQKAIRGRYNKYGEELMQQGVRKYIQSTGSLNHPALGIQGDIITSDQHAQRAVEMIATGFQIKGGNVDDYLDMATMSGIDEKVAKKAWNTASKEKLEKVAGFMSQPSPGPIARQKGMVDLFGKGKQDEFYSAAEDVLKAEKIQDTESMDKFFKKQVSRGNVQPAEYKDVVKPTINRMKELGLNKASGEQMVQYMDMSRPTFKTITKSGGDTAHDQYQFHPYNDAKLVPSNVGMKQDHTLISVDYKEHLFTARNESTEGPKGYVNNAHFSEPFVKGIARTSTMGNSTAPGKISNGQTFIQELQSDSANVARKYGEWSDEKIKELIPKADEEPESYSNRVFVSVLGEQKGKALIKKLDDGDFDRLTPEESKINDLAGESYHEVISNGSDRMGFEIFRQELASPSVFNNDKAWVRQTMRPVVNDALENGTNKIVLASSDIINQRWKGQAPHDKYQGEYPKIMKQYFKDIGVPEKDIHMPKKSSESFWVKLPRKLQEDYLYGKLKLPQYSVAGSAPVSMKFGEEDDK